MEFDVTFGDFNVKIGEFNVKFVKFNVKFVEFDVNLEQLPLLFRLIENNLCCINIRQSFINLILPPNYQFLIIICYNLSSLNSHFNCIKSNVL